VGRDRIASLLSLGELCSWSTTGQATVSVRERRVEV
jgi:hypothetical protein